METLLNVHLEDILSHPMRREACLPFQEGTRYLPEAMEVGNVQYVRVCPFGDRSF